MLERPSRIAGGREGKVIKNKNGGLRRFGMAWLNFVVTVVGGFFVLLFFSIFIYILYRGVLKPLGVMEKIKRWRMKKRRSALLNDESVLKFCITRIEEGKKESDVRAELLLSNKYTKQKIDELVYAYSIVLKEMQQEDKQRDVAEDLP